MMTGVWRFLVTALWAEQRYDQVFTSTSQAACLSPLRVNSTVIDDGVIVGRSLTTGLPATWSTHERYRSRYTPGLNAVNIGDTRRGKSSLTKTVEILRKLLVGGRALVYDRKREEGENSSHGEYLELAESVGDRAEIIIFDRLSAARLNILDPVLQSVGKDRGTLVGQDDLLKMAVELASGQPLVNTTDSFPKWALTVAHRRAVGRAHVEGRVPVIQDVIDALLSPSVESIPGPRLPDGTPVLESFGVFTPASMARWGSQVAVDLMEYTEGSLSGLIDGQTCGPDGRPLDLSAPLLVVDTSALPEGSAALGLMMAVMSAFTQARWTSVPGDKTIIIEEAYNLDLLPGIPRVMRQLAKRGSASGTSMLTNLHHLSDLQPGSEMWSMVREADTVRIFQQANKDDALQVCEFWGLEPDRYLDVIMRLGNHQHLLRVTGQQPEVIEHLLARGEEPLINTDGALLRLGDYS